MSWVHSGSAVSDVPCASSGEVISGCGPPDRCQPSRIPGKLDKKLGACLQFGRGCHLWGRDCPLPSGSGCCRPASLPLVGDGPVHSWLALLWCSLSSLFCEQAQQCLRLELLVGKFSLSFLFFFSLWLSHSLGCCLTLAPSDCPQGIQALSLP